MSRLCEVFVDCTLFASSRDLSTASSFIVGPQAVLGTACSPNALLVAPPAADNVYKFLEVQLIDCLTGEVLPWPSTRIKDAGIAICHSRKYSVSILKCPEIGWRGWTSQAADTKRKLYLRKL